MENKNIEKIYCYFDNNANNFNDILSKIFKDYLENQKYIDEKKDNEISI